MNISLLLGFMLEIVTLLVSDFQQNARILRDHSSKKSVIIDPGAEAELLIDAATSDGFLLEAIFLTHCHIDHGGAVKRIFSLINYPLQLMYHSLDQPLADSIELYAAQCGLSGYDNVPKATDYIDDLAMITFGNISLSCLFTPGHAPGHVAFFYEGGEVVLRDMFGVTTTQDPILLAGDALFKGSIGRTDLPFGDTSLLINSIKTQLFKLPDHTRVLSGHGVNTTIGAEKTGNPFLS